MMLIDLWVLAILIELVIVLSAALALAFARSSRHANTRVHEDQPGAAHEAVTAAVDGPTARAKARRARNGRAALDTGSQGPQPTDAGDAESAAAAHAPGSTPVLRVESPRFAAQPGRARPPAPPLETDADATLDAVERDSIPIETSDLDTSADAELGTPIRAEPAPPQPVSMPPIAVELAMSSARSAFEDDDDESAIDEPPAPGAEEIAALEAEAIEAARPTPIFLDAEDLASLNDGGGDGFTEDELMMLQDLVSSTEAKVKREAKSMQNLLDRLNGESAALSGAAEEVNRTLEAEGIVEEVAVRLKKVAPALDSARSALSEVGPDLQDLQDTLRAIAGALANYQQSTAKEWHLNRPSADAINALIRAKAEKLSG